MASQVFISYAHDDDLPPPDAPDAKGFVTFLYEQLVYELKQLGQPYPILFRDELRISAAEQFATRLEDALKSSPLLLVVLSNNWLARPYCRWELDYFGKLALAAGDDPKSRIVVVAKSLISLEARPEWLQGQEGYSFFAPDEAGRPGYEKVFLERGKVQDPRYFARVKELARYLWSHAAPPRTEPGSPANSGLSHGKDPEVDEPVPASSRTVFVAKPAEDMRQPYHRIVEELSRMAIKVVPDPAVEIPNDTSAKSFVETALAQAEFSIHLLGRLGGFIPEGASPIAKLQLETAATRAQAQAVLGSGANTANPFRRLIWAPKVVEALPATQENEVRDPVAVLKEFGQPVLSCDKILGDIICSFLNFVRDYLKSTTPRPKPVDLEAGAEIYVYHRIEDTDYAMDVAQALRDLEYQPVLPALEGARVDLDSFHLDNLRHCEKVFLCWAKAPEVWVRTMAREFRVLAEGDRQLKIRCRGIIGPPPGPRKSTLLQLVPTREFEALHDLTSVMKLTPDDLKPCCR